MTYAFIEQDSSTGKWHVLRLYDHQYPKAVTSRDEAELIVEALNRAYDRGRSDIQSGLRELIGAAREPFE